MAPTGSRTGAAGTEVGDAPRAASAVRVPVLVLTGFLGSGKTTLLKRLLSHEEMNDTAVLINEIGEIALDHHLIADVREDLVVLASGCVCCSVRNDLVRAMCELYVKAQRAEIPPFRRVIIETTGLADPTPVLATLAKHGLVTHGYRLHTVVATVDGQNGHDSFERHPEAVKQAAMADRIVLTKVDLLTPDERARILRRTREIQRLAPIVEGAHGHVHPRDLFGDGSSDHLRFARLPIVDEHPADHDDAAHAHDHAHAHGDAVRTFSVVFDHPLPFEPFALWLSMTTQFYGDHLLRFKGVLNVADDDRPVVVQAVQHVVYRTETLPRWPDADRRSRLVFIARGLDDATLAQIRSSLVATVGGDPT